MEVHVRIWQHEGGINPYIGARDCDFWRSGFSWWKYSVGPWIHLLVVEETIACNGVGQYDRFFWDFHRWTHSARRKMYLFNVLHCLLASMSKFTLTIITLASNKWTWKQDKTRGKRRDHFGDAYHRKSMPTREYGQLLGTFFGSQFFYIGVRGSLVHMILKCMN
jgi:type IV secretory pathway TraG/TraD family ATPase VirD4